MNRDKMEKMEKAEAAAREFLARVEAMRARIESDGNRVWLCGSTESGALRRQSLELTRALAEMRRPG